MLVTNETSHVFMAGVHAPTGDSAKQLSTAVISDALVYDTADVWQTRNTITMHELRYAMNQTPYSLFLCGAYKKKRGIFIHLNQCVHVHDRTGCALRDERARRARTGGARVVCQCFRSAILSHGPV